MDDTAAREAAEKANLGLVPELGNSSGGEETETYTKMVRTGVLGGGTTFSALATTGLEEQSDSDDDTVTGVPPVPTRKAPPPPTGASGKAAPPLPAKKGTAFTVPVSHEFLDESFYEVAENYLTQQSKGNSTQSAKSLKTLATRGKNLFGRFSEAQELCKELPKDFPRIHIIELTTKKDAHWEITKDGFESGQQAQDATVLTAGPTVYLQKGKFYAERPVAGAEMFPVDLRSPRNTDKKKKKKDKKEAKATHNVGAPPLTGTSTSTTTTRDQSYLLARDELAEVALELPPVKLTKLSLADIENIRNESIGILARYRPHTREHRAAQTTFNNLRQRLSDVPRGYTVGSLHSFNTAKDGDPEQLDFHIQCGPADKYNPGEGISFKIIDAIVKVLLVFAVLLAMGAQAFLAYLLVAQKLKWDVELALGVLWGAMAGKSALLTVKGWNNFTNVSQMIHRLIFRLIPNKDGETVKLFQKFMNGEYSTNNISGMLGDAALDAIPIITFTLITQYGFAQLVDFLTANPQSGWFHQAMLGFAQSKGWEIAAIIGSGLGNALSRKPISEWARGTFVTTVQDGQIALRQGRYLQARYFTGLAIAVGTFGAFVVPGLAKNFFELMLSLVNPRVFPFPPTGNTTSNITDFMNTTLAPSAQMYPIDYFSYVIAAGAAIWLSEMYFAAAIGTMRGITETSFDFVTRNIHWPSFSDHNGNRFSPSAQLAINAIAASFSLPFLVLGVFPLAYQQLVTGNTAMIYIIATVVTGFMLELSLFDVMQLVIEKLIELTQYIARCGKDAQQQPRVELLDEQKENKGKDEQSVLPITTKNTPTEDDLLISGNQEIPDAVFKDKCCSWKNVSSGFKSAARTFASFWPCGAKPLSDTYDDARSYSDHPDNQLAYGSGNGYQKLG